MFAQQWAFPVLVPDAVGFTSEIWNMVHWTNDDRILFTGSHQLRHFRHDQDAFHPKLDATIAAPNCSDALTEFNSLHLPSIPPARPFGAHPYVKSIWTHLHPHPSPECSLVAMLSLHGALVIGEFSSELVHGVSTEAVKTLDLSPVLSTDQFTTNVSVSVPAESVIDVVWLGRDNDGSVTLFVMAASRFVVVSIEADLSGAKVLGQIMTPTIPGAAGLVIGDNGEVNVYVGDLLGHVRVLKISQPDDGDGVVEIVNQLEKSVVPPSPVAISHVIPTHVGAVMFFSGTRFCLLKRDGTATAWATIHEHLLPVAFHWTDVGSGLLLMDNGTIVCCTVDEGGQVHWSVVVGLPEKALGMALDPSKTLVAVLTAHSSSTDPTLYILRTSDTFSSLAENHSIVPSSIWHMPSSLTEVVTYAKDQLESFESRLIQDQGEGASGSSPPPYSLHLARLALSGGLNACTGDPLLVLGRLLPVSLGGWDDPPDPNPMAGIDDDDDDDGSGRPRRLYRRKVIKSEDFSITGDSFEGLPLGLGYRNVLVGGIRGYKEYYSKLVTRRTKLKKARSSIVKAEKLEDMEDTGVDDPELKDAMRCDKSRDLAVEMVSLLSQVDLRLMILSWSSLGVPKQPWISGWLSHAQDALLEMAPASRAIYNGLLNQMRGQLGTEVPEVTVIVCDLCGNAPSLLKPICKEGHATAGICRWSGDPAIRITPGQLLGCKSCGNVYADPGGDDDRPRQCILCGLGLSRS